MPEVERSIEAKVAANDIAAIIESPEAIPSWNPYIRKVAEIGAARRKGGRLRWTARVSGVDLSGSSEVRRWTSGRTYEWENRADCSGLTLIGRLELTATDGGTRVTARLRYEMPRGITTIVHGSGVRQLLERGLDQALRNLVKVARTRSR